MGYAEPADVPAALERVLRTIRPFAVALLNILASTGWNHPPIRRCSSGNPAHLPDDIPAQEATTDLLTLEVIAGHDPLQ